MGVSICGVSMSVGVSVSSSYWPCCRLDGWMDGGMGRGDVWEGGGGRMERRGYIRGGR